MKKCSIKGCPGHYEKKDITHVVNKHGQIIIIENVPAEVCTVCGDTLLTLDVVRALEKFLANPGEPSKSAPVYEMPSKEMAA